MTDLTTPERIQQASEKTERTREALARKFVEDQHQSDPEGTAVLLAALGLDEPETAANTSRLREALEPDLGRTA